MHYILQGDSEDIDEVVLELRKQYLSTVTKIKGRFQSSLFTSGELLVYQCLWHPSVVCQHFQTSSETIRPIQLKFHMETPYGRETQKFAQMFLVI